MDDFEEKLISLVREKEYLYNPRSRSYKNVLKRDAGWEIIAAALNTPAPRCKQRWKSLRDRFVREKRKMEDLAGTPAESEHEVWNLYESLQFLNDALKPKRRRVKYGNMTSPLMEESSEMGNDILFEEYIIKERPLTPVEEVVPKKPRTKEAPADKLFADLSKTLSQRFNTPELDENDLFMKMIAKKMKVLPEISKMRLQAKIFKMVNDDVLTFLDTS